MENETEQITRIEKIGYKYIIFRLSYSRTILIAHNWLNSLACLPTQRSFLQMKTRIYFN